VEGVNPEIRNRIRLAVAAYAYEFENDPIMSDAEFDALATEINDWVATGNKKLDVFFRDKFLPDTGMWVHSHPDIPGLRRLYHTFYKEGMKPSAAEFAEIEELV
jgi:hypothetical protein